MDKSTGLKLKHRRELPPGWVAQRAVLQHLDPGCVFKGLGVAEWYCTIDFIGDSFVQGAITKYWAFTRGGAWRNPNPTGGPYICEQCYLDARSGNDGTRPLQAVTVIELVLWTYAPTAGRGCWRNWRSKIKPSGDGPFPIRRITMRDQAEKTEALQGDLEEG